MDATSVERAERRTGAGAAGTRVGRAVEFGLLFVGLPLALWMRRDWFAEYVIPGIVVGGIACGAVLLLDRSFERRSLWVRSRLGWSVLTVLMAFVPLAVAMAFAVALADGATGRDTLFELPRRSPGLWVSILFLYPIFSAYPQEVIYRTFFFHRYGCLFGTGWPMVIASGLAFGWAHIIMNQPLAVALSALGGVLFAWTYARTRSTLVCAIEHGLWGDFIFTVGLGYYFFAPAAIGGGGP